jgi:hypothetical protein
MPFHWKQSSARSRLIFYSIRYKNKNFCQNKPIGAMQSK